MTTDDLNAIAKANIARLLERLGEKPTTFSKRIGMGPNTIAERLRGDLGFNLASIQRIADGGGVSVLDLLTPPAEAGRSDEPPAAGFSECPVSRIEGPPSGEGAESAMPEGFAAQFVVGGAGAPGFGIARGDQLQIDMRRAAEDGSVVVATIVDMDTGAARSVLGRKLGPYMVGPDFPSRPHDFTLIDGARVVVLGVVASLFRPFVR